MINKNITVKIDGKKYKLKKHSYRAMMQFEELAQKPIVKMKTFRDQITFLYCLLNASNEDFSYTFDEFIDVLEEDDKIFQQFVGLVYDKTGTEEEAKKKAMKNL